MYRKKVSLAGYLLLDAIYDYEKREASFVALLIYTDFFFIHDRKTMVLVVLCH